jgi:hypothetical protein
MTWRDYDGDSFHLGRTTQHGEREGPLDNALRPLSKQRVLTDAEYRYEVDRLDRIALIVERRQETRADT